MRMPKGAKVAEFEKLDDAGKEAIRKRSRDECAKTGSVGGEAPGALALDGRGR
jgi:hypothetical protein